MILCLCLGALALGQRASATEPKVKLPAVFGDHMVLQRGIPLPVWGWAAPKERVSVRIGGQEVRTKADNKGAWRVELPPLKIGVPKTLTVKGENSSVRITDVLVGEVWVCSGQSNMEWGMHQVDDSEKEIAGAKYPNIRLFLVPKRSLGEPAEDLEAEWRRCSPDNILYDGRGFSAVAYLFGREIHKELDVPVGLIATSWGGTRIEPWTPPEGFASVEALADIVERIGKANAKYGEAFGEHLDETAAWVRAARRAIGKGTAIPPRPVMGTEHELKSHRNPTSLYNGMVHALVPFGIRGAIWYQGESNRGEGMLYHEKMKALIGGWREVWGQGDFPFYYVQLAPYGYTSRGKQPDPKGARMLPEMWEAQIATLAVPNTGMAGTCDIGNIKDIHPRNKQDVGRRLALNALAKTYGKKNLVYSGPMYASMKVEGGKIRVRFDHVGSGLETRDGKNPTWFEIAGENGEYVQAKAFIEDDAVVVWSGDVEKPASIRYAWHEQAEPNLKNAEGLPALPFRTKK